MNYFAVWYGVGGLKKSKPTTKADAFQQVEALRRFELVAWVEDEEGNKIHEMTAQEIIEREA